MRVGIIGASGFVGGELLRILMIHPQTEVKVVTSRTYSGDYIHRVHPNLKSFTDLQFSDLNLDEITDQCDMVFTAVPHGTSVKIMPQLAASGIKIIDMSADYRLRNPKDYETWYGYTHPQPEMLDQFTLGIPELKREKIRSSSLVSTPGCMAVTSILALAPLVKAGLVGSNNIIIDAKVGSSGAGTKPTMASHHAERYGVIRPYKPVGHRHTAEIEQELSALSSSSVHVSLSTHAVNIVRGILCTSYPELERETSSKEIWSTYRSFYQNEPFIRFIRDRKGIYRYPDPKILIGSNFCDIGFELSGSRLVVLSSTDNLVKGASGIAVQCMNIMMGFDENTGLNYPGIHPV